MLLNNNEEENIDDNENNSEEEKEKENIITPDSPILKPFHSSPLSYLKPTQFLGSFATNLIPSLLKSKMSDIVVDKNKLIKQTPSPQESNKPKSEVKEIKSNTVSQSVLETFTLPINIISQKDNKNTKHKKNKKKIKKKKKKNIQINNNSELDKETNNIKYSENIISPISLQHCFYDQITLIDEYKNPFFYVDGIKDYLISLNQPYLEDTNVKSKNKSILLDRINLYYIGWNNFILENKSCIIIDDTNCVYELNSFSLFNVNNNNY